MHNAIRRVFMFLLGVSLGYCTGFQDAQDNERNVLVRMVERVQAFGEASVRNRERAVEEAVGE